MLNRRERSRMAVETLNIIDQGYYENDDEEKINISDSVEYAVENSKLYTPNFFENMDDKIEDIIAKKENVETEIEVNNEQTLKAARRLVEKENYQEVVCLNFASATNPGGGFLQGSSAQEESLARSSALYPCIKQMEEMYEANKKYESALYKDYMIYSPAVPVFRNHQGELLDNPYQVSFITAPAVNAGVVRSRESQENIGKIGKTMENRIEKIMALTLIHENEALVLGAFGCGVFKNNPSYVAEYFQKYVLTDERFNDYFKKVSFAVLDNTPDKKNVHIFKEKLT